MRAGGRTGGDGQTNRIMILFGREEAGHRLRIQSCPRGEVPLYTSAFCPLPGSSWNSTMES